MDVEGALFEGVVYFGLKGDFICGVVGGLENVGKKRGRQEERSDDVRDMFEIFQLIAPLLYSLSPPLTQLAAPHYARRR